MEYDLPRPSRALTLATQVLLGILFLVGLGVAALLPSFSSYIAASVPEFAQLRPPLLTVAIAFTLLGLTTIALVAILVHRVYRGTMLTRSSLLWVNGIVAALAGAAALIVVAFIVISNGQAGSPALALIQAMACLTLIALASITLVLRSLLKSAITLRAELDQVV